MKIDFHCHSFPAEIMDALKEDRPDLPRWNDNRRLEEIDRAGVDVEILSNPVMYRTVTEDSPRICRSMNDILAESCQRNPARFRAFAHLPFTDMNAALKEMERAIDELGFAGVVIGSNVGGRYMHTPEFNPFWEEVNRRRVPVFMHPGESPCYKDDEPPPIFILPFDTTLAVTKLISRGLFERFPDVVLIVAHLGATLPYLASRIDLGFTTFARDTWKISRLPSEYMKKLYLDTAMSWDKAAFRCARELVGIEHIVMGTDHFNTENHFMQRTVEYLASLDVITPAERELIYHGNAERILKRD